MKKVLFSIVLVLSSLSASAANWNLVGQTVEQAYHYVDKESLVYQQKHVVAGWVYVANTNSVTYSYTRYEVHCPTRMFRIPVTTKYYSNGVVMDVANMYTWEYAMPDSIAMATIKMMCGVK